MLKYDYNVQRTKNRVQINVREWVQPTDTLEIHKMSGRAFLTYINKALKVHNETFSDVKINEGDTILINKVASEIAVSPTIPYLLEDREYFDVPISQILGVFRGDVSLNNLELTCGKVLYKRVDRTMSSQLLIPDKSTTMGFVRKLPSNYKGKLQEGMLVLVKDNVSTDLYWAQGYSITEEKDIIAIAEIQPAGDTVLKLNVINNYTLMKPYISTNVLNSNLLISPDINYEDLDYSDMYNRNLFKVCVTDENTGLIEGDILVLNRDYTTYVYFNNEKYFAIENGKEWISARINERDK